MLPLQVQRGAAGGQHLHGGTGGEEATRERGHGGDEVLAVVEDEQLLPRPQGREERRFGVGGLAAQADRPAHRTEDERRIVQRREIDEATPSAKCLFASLAMARAKRVLPMPPGPVSVRRGTASSSSSRCPAAVSASRPMSRLRGWGSEESEVTATGAVMDDPTAWEQADGAASVTSSRRCVNRPLHRTQCL